MALVDDLLPCLELHLLGRFGKRDPPPAGGTEHARRSELMNSLIENFDFEAGQIMIRERKRRKDLSRSFRYLPLHPRLAKVMKSWFAVHPGGQQTLVMPASVPRRRALDASPTLSRNSSTHHFKQTLKKSSWKVVRGLHVLRHSFGSNIVRTGQVPPEIVGRWMGHTTEEMREHYQHLFPQDGVHQIGVLR